MSQGYQPGNWNRRILDPNFNVAWDRSEQLDRTPFAPSFIDRQGRRCRIVCDGRPHNSYNPQQDLRRIANRIIGRNIYEAMRIYPNIRPIIQDGQEQIVKQDLRKDRINVEIRNNIIIRVLGFY